MACEQQNRTKDLFLQTLTKMGCQYDIDDEDNDLIHFAYQGEYFCANSKNDCDYIRLCDYRWMWVSLDDIDEVSRLRKAINEANWKNSVTTLYSIDDAEMKMYVHCKEIIFFNHQILDPEDYLRIEFHEFFHAHRLVEIEMDELRKKEQA